MRVGRSGIQICSVVPGSINNSILWDRKCPKKNCWKDYEVLKYFFQYLQRKIMWETAKKTFNQTEWVYDCSWWQRALKDFSQRVFANLRDSPGVASRWSQVGVFANLSGPARNPRTPLYYANTAKLFNKYNHSIDANTGGFAKYATKLIIFAIYEESMSFLGPTMTVGGQIKIHNHFYVTNIPLEIFF